MAPRVSSLLLGTFLLSTTEAFQFGQPKSFMPPPSSSKSTVGNVSPSLVEDAVGTVKNFAAMVALASSVALGAMSLDAPPAQAVEKSNAIQVQVDAPTLARRLKTKFYEKELLEALQQVQEVIGPDAVKVTLPSNVAGATRDLLSGRGEITVNGKPVDIAVLSSEKGEITIRVSNSLIPKVPLLSTRTKIPFSGTASDQGTDTSEADWGVLADVAGVFGVDLKTPFIEQAARAYGLDLKTPFFDQKFLGGLVSIPIPRNEDSGGTFTYVAKNKDVAGVTGLTLAVAYSSSYAYYKSLIKAKEKAAEEKAAATKAKKEKDAKAKAAEATAAKAKE